MNNYFRTHILIVNHNTLKLMELKFRTWDGKKHIYSDDYKKEGNTVSETLALF